MALVICHTLDIYIHTNICIPFTSSYVSALFQFSFTNQVFPVDKIIALVSRMPFAD